jgi:chromosome segregation ATPase
MASYEQPSVPQDEPVNLQAAFDSLAITLDSVRTKAREFIDYVDVDMNSGEDSDRAALRRHSARLAVLTAPMDSLSTQISSALTAINHALDLAASAAKERASLQAKQQEVEDIKRGLVAQRQELEEIKSAFAEPKQDDLLVKALDTSKQQIETQRNAYEQQISDLRSDLQLKDKTNAVYLAEIDNLKTLNARLESKLQDMDSKLYVTSAELDTLRQERAASQLSSTQAFKLADKRVAQGTIFCGSRWCQF